MSPRKKEFDPDVALESAMRVFWTKGYEATSIQDLVDAMGINRFSIYDTFGDKREIFCAACQRYLNSVGLERLALIRESENGLDGIRKFFDTAVDFLGSEQGQDGCLMTNTANELSTVDEKARQVVDTFFVELLTEFRGALTKAKKLGLLSKSFDVGKGAQYLASNAQGIWVFGKVSPDRTTLNGIVELTMSTLT